MTCGHIDPYRCSRCGCCYICTHEPLRLPDHELAWVARGCFWKCPTGMIVPAIHEGDSLYQRGWRPKKGNQ